MELFLFQNLINSEGNELKTYNKSLGNCGQVSTRLYLTEDFL